MTKECGKAKAVHAKKCAVTHALEIIGGKWRLPIIWELSAQENMRYNELKRHLDGITNIMLTRALQGLEENGLIRRVEFARIPPHVEYSLTESCKQLLPALEIINEWGKNRMHNAGGKYGKRGTCRGDGGLTTALRPLRSRRTGDGSVSCSTPSASKKYREHKTGFTVLDIAS